MDETVPKGSKTISISVPVELSNWLDEHKNVNRSQLFSKAALDIINCKNKQMTPIFLLASVMGICFSVLLIISSVGLSFWLGVYMAAVMFMMGIALLSVVVIMFLRVNKKDDASTDELQ
jgi:hypothetical protein